MGHSYNLFKKEINQVTLADLEGFFSTEQEENAILEFKMGDVSLETVHKEVAAFANTQGGILILGTPRETSLPDRKHIKVCKGDLTPCSKILNQDSLIRSIASNISPSPTQVTAKEFSISGGSVYILEIEQSTNPPHQVNSLGAYFIRMERDTKAAPHGIVEALFYRRQKSDLFVKHYVLVKPNKLHSRLYFDITNRSIVHAEQSGWQLSIWGAKGCQECVNINMKDVADDYSNGVESRNHIFVKGMAIQMSIDLALRFPFFYYNLSYYATDSSLESIEGLFNTETAEYLFANNSKHPAENIGSCSSVKAEYDNLLKKKITILLKSGFYYNELRIEASQETIDDLEYQLGNNLPDSLRLFLKTSNGFVGEIKGRLLTIYSADDIIVANARKSYGAKDTRLSIGSIDKRPIYLKFEGGKPTLEWYSKEGHLYDQGTSSIFDILQYLYANPGDD